MEEVYKATKVKAPLKLYSNEDPTMNAVRQFEEQSTRTSHQSLLKDAIKYADELGIALNLTYPNPTCLNKDHDKEIPSKQISSSIKGRNRQHLKDTMEAEKWQGKLLTERWKDDNISDKCFEWLKNWNSCPSHVIAGMHELYEQLLPTKVYYSRKIGLTTNDDLRCRMCTKELESFPHVLAGCSALAQRKYMSRHNSALKILFFEILRDCGLIDKIPPWYSQVVPKPLYENENHKAFWDVPVYAENAEVRAKRIDARIINHEEKKITLLEMSCPWVENRCQKEVEKTRKYVLLQYELKQQFKGYKVEQFNIIMDVLGGYSAHLEENVKRLVGKKSNQVLRNMQKSAISSTLHITRTFKTFL